MIGAGNDKQVGYLFNKSWLHENSLPSFILFFQFATLATKILNRPGLAQDERFSTNSARVAYRKTLVPILTEILMEHDRDHWLEKFNGQGYVGG